MGRSWVKKSVVFASSLRMASYLVAELFTVSSVTLLPNTNNLPVYSEYHLSSILVNQFIDAGASFHPC